MMDLFALSTAINKTIIEAGKLVRSYHGNIKQSQIESKSTHDFVTEIDKKTERYLVEKLNRIIPEASFLTEEKTVEETTSSNWRFIIDPIDGTTNFIHGLFPVTLSVALQYKNETVVAAVYEIGANELFYAIRNKGAFLNGFPISVSSETSLEKSLLATGFPFKNYDRLNAYMKSFEYLMFHTSGLRRLGSAAADLVYVACGRMDGFYEYGLNPWDVAGGAFIVLEAGGQISDFSGRNNWLFGGEIVASNGRIHPEFLTALQKTLSPN